MAARLRGERWHEGGGTRSKVGTLQEAGWYDEGGGSAEGAHSRFAVISAVEPHLYDPSEHRNLKHEKAGTIVTSLATP